ncbi:BadF/BadG/BcrA/BcrD ATPase family protein [Planctobacterium marinum]|uniref:BadF/BadG/BcrA/BcrD ATPase family protein n=1 Tax=Planctobacterium marinum TaxID=1631968 RepID=UPI001E3CC37C|nr:BadF/BadG/BcrA/BcrD ATPase family protein [Planctobacterium marinum]MCC2606071.1 ATPase [Planctobacterium marinum]
MITEETLFLGVDGGGSKCRVILQDAQGRTLGEGLSGAANLLRGVKASQNAVMTAYYQAREQAGLESKDDHRVIAGLGLAGANIEHLKQAFLSQWQVDFAGVYLTTDLEIACLGAHKGEPGGVVIIGTGSCGLVIAEQQNYALGGHGFLLGDKGSGAWYGLKAMQHCLEAIDGLQPKGELASAVMALTGCQDESDLITRYANAMPKEFAVLAPLVFKQAQLGEPAAKKLLQEGVGYIESLCLKLLDKGPCRFSLIGGLSPLVAQQLSADLQQRLSPALNDPEVGAILYAKQALHLSKQCQASDTTNTYSET